jgi:RNA polymerase sigma-70 factor (ECF subfamily)
MKLSLASRSDDLDADATLVRRLRDGDATAGDELVDRYTPMLLGYLKRLARGNRQVADDLHQATWLSVLEHLDQFDPDGGGPGFKPWLFRIATNKAHDHFRRLGRESRRVDAVAHDPTLRRNDPDEADAASLVHEEQARVRAAVDRLPDAQRQVVELRCYGGLKFQEIADTLGCPLNTALGRMHKATKKLEIDLDESRNKPAPRGVSPSASFA